MPLLSSLAWFLIDSCKIVPGHHAWSDFTNKFFLVADDNPLGKKRGGA